MPQIWTSDDTDANERTHIQQGTSYGYPLSTMGAHLSDVPNHQTLRDTSLETRFNIAAFGVFGYEWEASIGNCPSWRWREVSTRVQVYVLESI